MAIIGKSKQVPEIEWLFGKPRIKEEEIVVFLNPDKSDRQFFNATRMVLSMAVTCMMRYGFPFKGSDLDKVSRIGIFAAWEAKKKLGKLCDAGYFSRWHVGKEEYFSPELKLYSFLEDTEYEIIS